MRTKEIRTVSQKPARSASNAVGIKAMDRTRNITNIIDIIQMALRFMVKSPIGFDYLK
jgi:hypothetical protein